MSGLCWGPSGSRPCRPDRCRRRGSVGQNRVSSHEVDPVTGHQDITGGLATIGEPRRHPAAVVADIDTAHGELDPDAVLDGLLP